MDLHYRKGWEDRMTSGDVVNVVDATLATTVIINGLRRKGLSIEYGVDFGVLERIKETLGAGVSEHFSQSHNTFFAGEAFWLCISDDAGNPIATHAVKVQNLGNERLDSFIQRYWPQIYGQDSALEVRFGERQRGFLQDITGTVAYAGELFVSDSARKLRIADLLCKYAQICAVLQWDIEFYYAFMEPRSVAKGLGTMGGFVRQHRMVPEPNSPVSQARGDFWFVGCSRSDIGDSIYDLKHSGLAE